MERYQTKSKWFQLPMSWIPSLYFAEGIPNIIVTFLACFMFKQLGLSNTEATFYTGWLYLPWVIKPLWSPFVDILKTKRWWILCMQLFIGAGLAGIAFTLPTHHFVTYSLWIFYLIAFSSATHDIAADGYYMIALDEQQQSLYVGIRSLAYRIAMIAGQGMLTLLAGYFEKYFNSPKEVWSLTFICASVIFFALFSWHIFALKKISTDDTTEPYSNTKKTPFIKKTFYNVLQTIKTFFSKEHIGIAIMFMLLFRFPEAMLTKICPLFYIDPIDKGGLGLSTTEVGILQGFIGISGLLIGGIIGGILIAKKGLKKWLWPMAFAITLPDAFYIFLSYFQPTNFFLISVLVLIEQFGYGFGFTAFMVYMLHFSQGKYKTAHYAFCTGFMALSMMIPGAICGYIEDYIGYTSFFILTMSLTPITFWVSKKVYHHL